MAKEVVGNPVAATSQRTSLVTVLTSEHGRQRRLERKIGVRDLQAAVKHGTRTAGFPCPRTGETRWRYTFAGVVYVTDSTSRHEITSWPAPALGLDVETVEVSAWTIYASLESLQESAPGGLTRDMETPLPSNSPHDHMILRVHLVDSHARWKRPCLQTTPDAMALYLNVNKNDVILYSATPCSTHLESLRRASQCIRLY
jgi:hypothetical protein